MGCSDSQTSSNQMNTYWPQAKGLMKAGSTDLTALLNQLSSVVNSSTGLTPQQRSFYGGQIQEGVAQNQGAQTQNFLGQMSRMGNEAGHGAVVQGLSDIARGGTEATAQGLSNLTGLGLQQQQTDTKNLMAALAMALYPQAKGSKGTTTTNPGLLGTLSAII